MLFVSSEETGLLFNPSYEQFPQAVKDFLETPELKNVINSTSSQTNHKTACFNSEKIFDTPSVVFVYKYGPSNSLHTGIVGFDVQSLTELMSTGSNNASLLADSNAHILVNPDYGSKKVLSEGIEVIIKELLENPSETNTQRVVDGVFTAVHQIKDDLFAITTISERSVYAVINRTTYRIILFSLAVLFIAIILIRIFSNGITNPIKELVGAAGQIEKGEFELSIKPRTRDEIGLLTESFVQMGKGLSEREKLMVSFSKFTNKTIAQKAASGELTLGGENRNATIFFSDIRSFTAMSEKMQPNEVVEFLNVYMTKMVDCINKMVVL